MLTTRSEIRRSRSQRDERYEDALKTSTSSFSRVGDAEMAGQRRKGEKGRVKAKSSARFSFCRATNTGTWKGESTSVYTIG